jgi:hypothetical protein
MTAEIAVGRTEYSDFLDVLGLNMFELDRPHSDVLKRERQRHGQKYYCYKMNLLQRQNYMSTTEKVS